MEFTGIGVCEGSISGTAVVFRHESSLKNDTSEQLTFEAAMERFNEGRRILYNELTDMAAQAKEKIGSDKAGIFEGFAEVIMDDEIESLTASFIKEGHTAAAAAQKALDEQARELESLESGYMQERGSDLTDIGRRLAAIISGEGHSLPVIKEPCILVADELSPFETVGLDHNLILGIAMDKGGVTGHAAILAKSLGIPCVVTLGDASVKTQSGSLCAMDGASGRFITDPDKETIAAFRQKEEERKLQFSFLLKAAAEPAVTTDGVSILVCANIGLPEEAQRAAVHGADGVGCFRTEFLYMDRQLPSEEEQFEALRQAQDALAGKPLTIRTLDIGGDKEHPALGLEKEDNPFLGYRAIRFSLDQPSIFKPQLRAILRAAAFGPIELMFPMIATLDEFRQAKIITEECIEELKSQGIKTGSPKLGIMIETPAAALLAREFAAEADFFSIGTNDLTQYTLAADRGSQRVSGLYDPLNPAVLRLMSLTCEAAEEAGISAGICGELAADARAVPLLVGLGLTKLSVSGSQIPAIKKEVRALKKEKCKALAKKALALSTAREVRALL